MPRQPTGKPTARDLPASIVIDADVGKLRGDIKTLMRHDRLDQVGLAHRIGAPQSRVNEFLTGPGPGEPDRLPSPRILLALLAWIDPDGVSKYVIRRGADHDPDEDLADAPGPDSLVA